MQGNPEVIAGLNAVYRLLLATEQQAHMQEHLYESMGYGFSDWFDDIEENGHQKLIHPLMKRLNALGAEPDWRYGFDPVVYGKLNGDSAEDVQLVQAVEGMLGCLSQIRTAYGKACDAAEADHDYETERMIWKMIKWVEKRILKFERRMRRIRRVGVKMFISEYK